jgi:hypothetical protein
MPLCEPVKEIASTPRRLIAIARSAMAMRSPADRSMSSSRRGGSSCTSRASFNNSSVVWPIAETTTTTSWPAARVATTRSATLPSFAGVATEVPPYFCTTMPMGAY